MAKGLPFMAIPGDQTVGTCYVETAQNPSDGSAVLNWENKVHESIQKMIRAESF